jgi:hypothetical protein
VLKRLEDKSLSEDDFLAETYARLVIVCALGYSPEALIKDAQRGVEQLNLLTQSMDE